ncbi:MAG TPA: DUF4231 domain-containing protein [Ktedonobacteraceae bacterium]|nr:DUF4231 domain-containing protein [Ktedonobacteraceae bacterium]
MELFRRFPTFQPLPREQQQLVPPDKRMLYSAFSKDFETLDRELMPSFRELDNEALSGQNRYRWMYVILIFGGAAVTVLGIFQLAFITMSWIGIIEAIVAGVVALATIVLQTFKDHERYLNARLATERLRSEYFLFLGQCEPYANEQERTRNLIHSVADIKAKGESV